MLARSTSWACKSLGMWDKQEVSSHIFFYAVIRTIKNFEKAESGDKEAKKRTMRKLFLFLLCTLSSFSMKATDYGKNITITKGQTTTLDLAADLGINYDYNGGTYIYFQEYTVSDETALSIVPQMHAINGSSSSQYYTYNITPQKTGSYTIVENFRLSLNRHGSDNQMTYNITVVDVTSISLPATYSMLKGDTKKLTPVIADSRATPSLTWTSTNPQIASVNQSGEITALEVGTTTISCINANGVSAQCKVTVNPVLTTSIELNCTETELLLDEKLQMTATVLPENATDKSIAWSSTNESVAIVDATGLVTAVGSGSCQIKASATDGSGITASCLITVPSNVLFCEDFGAVAGATVTLPIQLANTDAIQGFEFKLVLPEGVSVETDSNGKLTATLTERASTQGLEGAKQGNNTYQFVFTSMNRLSGNSGAVVNIPIVVAENIAIGQYDVIVKDVELVKYGTSSQIHHADRTATLNIKEMTVGDVNGDGRISEADAVSVINYVLGRTPISFITNAADVNGDGNISLADAVAIVDLILVGNNSNTKVTKMKKITDPQ